MFPLVVHQPASLSIWPAVQSLRRGLSNVCYVDMCLCFGGVGGVGGEWVGVLDRGRERWGGVMSV